MAFEYSLLGIRCDARRIIGLSAGCIALTGLVLAGCGADSGSGGSGGTGAGTGAGTPVTGGTTGGTAGTPVTGGTTGGTVAGTPPVGGTTGGTVAGMAGAAGTIPIDNLGDDCMQPTTASSAGHVIVQVMWEGTLGVAAGMTTMHLWNRADLTFSPDGTATGVVHPCGSQPPEFQKMGLAGTNKVKIEFPETTFDAPGIPTGMAAGMLTPPMGSDNPFAIGASIMMEPVGLAIGLDMADPINDPWITKGMGSKEAGADHDGDGAKGITAVPLKDATHDQPPISIFALTAGPFADKLYLALRLVVQLMGVRDTCMTAKGTANVMKLDTRVIGCHRTDGMECAAADSDFIDSQQVDIKVMSATYEMKSVEPTTTCAEIRTMLPAM